ncbi:MAG: DUF11 domain-containing protein, partial [Anaerolineae bacterium]|nr:DUF11 domain-containing protein [Anaerolineae bacterium]
PVGGSAVQFSGGTLAVGPSTCTINVMVTSNFAGTYTNSDAGGNIISTSVNLNSSGLAATLTVNAAANVVLSKSFTPGTINAGNTSTLRLTFTNPAGNPAISGLGFADLLPLPVDIAAAVTSPQCGGTITAPVGGSAILISGVSVAAGPATCNVDLTVTSNVAGVYTNGSANINSVTGPLDVSTASATLTVNAVGADVTLSKTFTPASIFEGGTSTLQFTLSNPAANPAQSGLSFTDTLPAGVTVSVAPAAAQCGGTVTAVAGGTTITLTGGTLAAGPSTCTINVTVTSGTAGVYTNNAGNLSGLSANLDATGISATLTVNAAGSATLSKTFTPATIIIGGTSTLQFTLSNPAANPAQAGLAFTDTLPAGVTVSVAPAAAQCGGTVTAVAGGTTITLTGGTLAAGPSTCTINVTVTSSVIGVYTNNAGNISGLSANLNATGIGATLTVNAAGSATLSKAFAPATILTGETSVLQFTLSNPAANPAQTGLAFTDTLPAGMTVSVAPAAAQCGGTVTAVAGGNTIDFTGGTLAAGPSTCTINVTVTSSTAGSHTNNAANISGLSANLDATGISATLTVNPAAALTKQFMTTPISAGQTSTLQFTITNNSATAAQTGLSFTDTLVPEVTVVSAAAAQCGGTVTAAAGSSVISFSGGSLAAGGNCLITVNVTSSTAGSHPNNAANISGLSDNLNASGVNATLVVQASEPLLSKQFTPLTIRVGQSATLTFTITNGTGNPAQSGLGFTDTLPAGLRVAVAPSSPQCGGTVTAPMGSSTITFTGGSLAAAQVDCQVFVTVTSSTVGIYTNNATNISNLQGGLLATGISATLTVDPAREPQDDDGDEDDGGPVVTAEDHARAQAPLCADMDGSTNPIIRASVPPATVPDGGVYCRVLAEDGLYVNGNQAASVGNMDVLNMGVIQAVDVFGMAGEYAVPNFSSSITVCLEGYGGFIYLDARTYPRAVTRLPTWASGNYTCATVLNAGTVVLVQQ